MLDAVRRTYRVVGARFAGVELSADIDELVDEREFEAFASRLESVTTRMTATALFENRPARAAVPDAFPALLERGDVAPIGPGMFVLQGEFLRLLQHFNNYWRAMAVALGAIEQDTPALWPVGLYREIGYLEEFPHQAILATSVRPQHADLAAVAASCTKASGFDRIDVSAHMAPSTFGLQSAVCDACYYAMRGTRRAANSLYTTYNKVFRNETSTRGSFDRLTSFSVRDVMAVGERRYVLAQRQKMLDLAIGFIVGLDLDCSITSASDPFFGGQAIVKSVYQRASDLKYELVASLPFAATSLAIGSINLHEDFFGRAFDITVPDGSPAWSACLGVGFERLVYALYCQYGIEQTLWPVSLRAMVED